MKKIIFILLIATMAVFAKNYGYSTKSYSYKNTYHTYSTYKTPRYSTTSYYNSRCTSGYYTRTKGIRTYTNNKGYSSSTYSYGKNHYYTNSNGKSYYYYR